MSCPNCVQGGHPRHCVIENHPCRSPIAKEFMDKLYEALMQVDDSSREQMAEVFGDLTPELENLIKGEAQFRLYDTLGVMMDQVRKG